MELTLTQFQSSKLPASEELYGAVVEAEQLMEKICSAIPEKAVVQSYIQRHSLLSTGAFKVRWKPSQAVDGSKRVGGPDLRADRNRDLDAADHKYIRKNLLRCFKFVVNSVAGFAERMMKVQSGEVRDRQEAGDKEEELTGRSANETDRMDVADEEALLEAKIQKAKDSAAVHGKAYLRALQDIRLLEQQRDHVEPQDEKASCIAMVMRPAFGGPHLSYSHANFQGEEEPLSPGFQSIIIAKMASPSTVAANIKESNRR